MLTGSQKRTLSRARRIHFRPSGNIFTVLSCMFPISLMTICLYVSVGKHISPVRFLLHVRPIIRKMFGEDCKLWHGGWMGQGNWLADGADVWISNVPTNPYSRMRSALSYTNSVAFSSPGSYADWPAAAFRRSKYQLLQIEVVTRSAQRIPTAVHVAPQSSSRGWVDPVRDPELHRKSGTAGNRSRSVRICSQELWPLDHSSLKYLSPTGLN
jgi:hypothetical protein